MMQGVVSLEMQCKGSHAIFSAAEDLPRFAEFPEIKRGKERYFKALSVRALIPVRSDPNPSSQHTAFPCTVCVSVVFQSYCI